METETKWFISISLILIFTIASIIVFLVIKERGTEFPQQSSLEECKTLINNGREAIDIVFISDKEGAQKYSDFFFNTYPYSIRKDKFNIHYIDTYKPECEIYKKIALFCYSKETVKASASCPDDIVIILKEGERQLRSSAYLNYISVNTNHQETVLTHELGHVIGNKAEEYINNKNPPEDSDNCPGECDKFNDLEEGCFQGCSKQNLIRSIGSGVMRTLGSNKYGNFNSIGILEEIDNAQKIKLSMLEGEIGEEPTISGFAVDEILTCEEKSYYLIDINVMEGKQIGEARLPGCAAEKIGAGSDKYIVLTRDLQGNKQTRIEKEFNFIIYTEAQSEEANFIDNAEQFENPGDIITTLAIPANLGDTELLISNDAWPEDIKVDLTKVGRRPCPEK